MLALLFALAVAAQDTPPPAFEVASVKHSGNTSMMISEGDGRARSATRGFVYTGSKVTCNLPLNAIVQEAWGVKPFQVQGPGWISTETYEIAATMPDGTSRDTARLMLRALLTERFGLQLHHEEKEISVLGLVRLPGPSKLEEVVPAPASFRYTVTTNSLDADAGMPLSALTNILNRAAGKPVLDQTGLTGNYKIHLRWNGEPLDLTSKAPIMIGSDPGMLSAMPQIGLKLESQKKVFDVLVVDKASREPTEN